MNKKEAFKNSFEFWVAFMIGIMLALVGFLFINKAQASSPLLNNVTSDTGALTGWFTQRLGGGISGTLTNIKLINNTNSCSGQLFSYSDENYTTDKTYEFGTANMCAEGGWDTSFNFNPDRFYSLGVSSSGTYTGSATTEWINGQLCGGYEWSVTPYDCGSLSLKSVYFNFTGASYTPAGPPPSSISLLTPTTSTVSDFRLWETSYDNTTTTAGKIKTLVFYTTASEENTYVDASISTTTASSTSFFQTKGRAIPLNQMWSAYAGLYLIPDSNPETSILLATSTIVNFTLTSPIAGGIYGTSTPTSTTSTLSVTCDPSLGAFQYSFCYVIQYLFYPDSGDLDIYTNIYDGIKNKPPFGYFTAISNVLSGFSTSTTSTISLPDLSSMSDEFDVIKTTVSVILWVAFGFWIFHKFRHIQL